MSDPLLDPAFPDRPSHPDFWRISDAILSLDGDATEGGKSVEQIMHGLVDEKSLFYMATQRAKRVPTPLSYGGALWIDGFIAGLLFQEKGGHRDA